MRMKKEAWPWVGRTENEMGSMAPSGSFTDISNDAYEGYDLLSPVKYNHEHMISETGSEGMRNIVEPSFADMQDEELSALKDMLQQIRDSLEDNMTVAAMGRLGRECSKAFLDKKVNIVSLHKTSEAVADNSGIHKDSVCTMFHRFQARLDGFILDASRSPREEVLLSSRNLSEQTAFGGIGIIIAAPNTAMGETIERGGFRILKRHSGLCDKYLVTSAKISKVAVARYYDDTSTEVASFLCDMADTSEEKRDGLQAYSRLKKECGLVFSYKRPSDVMFHMGSVSYPIDIIFMDKDDNVKKIYRDIPPGSPEVFGASGISNVLEISGGLCNLLDIKVGGKIFITRGEAYSGDIEKIGSLLSDLNINGVAFKHTDSGSPAAYRVSGNSIIRLNGGGAPTISNVMRKLATRNIALEKKNMAIDIDTFFESLGNIRLYSSEPPNAKGRIHCGIYNETFSIKEGSHIDIPALTFFRKGTYKRFNQNYSFVNNKSILEAFSVDHKKLLKKLSAKGTRDIIVVSREDLEKDLVEIFLERAVKKVFGGEACITSTLLQVPKCFGSESAYRAVEQRYGESDLYSHALVKEGGMPVSEGTKDKARHALRYITRSSDICGKLLDNFSKNLEAYKKVSGDADAIAASKGQYNQSCKRNSRMAKRMLLNIKSNIQILNEIKDISTTSEVIGSIAEAAKVSSGAVKDIIELINVIDTEDFLERLEESTGKATSSLEDMQMTLNRTKDYINSDILGILVLTE
jgi:uncharacterized membrane protein (UPF0127 family)